jgi:hypothetical protein
MNGVDKTDEAGHSGGKNRQPVVWFEVEDFLRYFDHFRNPTGLQRVPFEIFVEAEKLYGQTGRVRFCRLSVYTKQFQAVGFEEIISAYLDPPGASAPWKTIWGPARFWDKFSTMLPVIVRNPRFFFSIFKSAVRDLIRMAIPWRHFGQFVQRGDIVVSLVAGLGSSSLCRAYRRSEAALRDQVLVPDLRSHSDRKSIVRRATARYPIQKLASRGHIHRRRGTHDIEAFARCFDQIGGGRRVVTASCRGRGAGLRLERSAGGGRPEDDKLSAALCAVRFHD